MSDIYSIASKAWLDPLLAAYLALFVGLKHSGADRNQQTVKKTFWAYAVIIVSGTFAFLVFSETIYLFTCKKCRKVD